MKKQTNELRNKEMEIGKNKIKILQRKMDYFF